MKCRNCGSELSEYASFCPECGLSVGFVPSYHAAVICSECGTGNKPDDKFCKKCGHGLNDESTKKITVDEKAKNHIYCEKCGARLPLDSDVCVSCGFNQNKSENEPSKKVGYLLIALLAVFAVVSIASVIWLASKNSDRKNKNDAETHTQAADDVTQLQNDIYTSDAATGMPVKEGAVRDPVYNTYNDYEYSFSCSYPAHFVAESNNSDDARYILNAPDGTAKLRICAYDNSSGMSPQQVISKFKSDYPGTVDYENYKDEWCVISTIRNDKCHYGYYNMRDGVVRGFELHYDMDKSDVYDIYVEEIYDSLVFN